MPYGVPRVKTKPARDRTHTTDESIPAATVTRTRRQKAHGQTMTAAERRDAKEIFLEAFAKSGIVAAGCEAAGISYSTLHRWKHGDATFRALFDEAMEKANDVIRSRIYHLGVVGVKRIRRRFWKGELIDEEQWTEWNTRCLELLAKSRMPEFREGHQDVGAGPDPVKMLIGFDVEKV